MKQTQSAAEREFLLRNAINAVCQDHGAELEVTDDGKPYGLHSGVLRITMQSVFEGDECVKEFCEFEW
jgi:hypothetical protein